MNTDEVETGHPRRWSILVTLCAALLIIVVDNTVVSIALPAIAARFDAGGAGLQAVVDAYVVVFAGLLVIAGAGADRYGRRRALLAGLVIFGVASIAATLASSLWWLIGMRAVMGAGAALVMPATLAVLVQVFPATERPRAFAVWAAVAAVAMAAGPVLGGLLIAAWSWAAVFLVNVPVVAVALVGVAWLIPEFRDPRPTPIDPAGAGLVTLGMVALVATLIMLGELGPTDPRVETGAALALAGLSLFGWRQHRQPSPMVTLSVYRDRGFAGASAAATLLTLGTGSALFVLSQYLQLVLGLDPTQAGLALAPLALGVVAGSAFGGRAPARIGARYSIAAGFATTAAGFVILAALGLDSGYAHTALGLALLGLGTGFSSPAVTSTVLASVPRNRAGMASALNDTHQQLGIGLGVAALGSLLSATYRAGLPPAVPREAGTSLAATLAFARGNADQAALAHQAFVTAQHATMLTAAGAATAGALVALAVLPPDRP